MKFFIKDFSGKCDQIRPFLRIWSHLLKRSLMESLIFCVVKCSKIPNTLKISLKSAYSVLNTGRYQPKKTLYLYIFGTGVIFDNQI